MRTLLAAAALAAFATPSRTADVTWLMPPEIYCPIGQNVLPIIVGEDGGMGIDSLDCERVQLEGGRVHSLACVANGGSRLTYDTDLHVLVSGATVHDGVIFRRHEGPRPCPKV